MSLAVYQLSPTVVTLEKVRNEETKDLDGAAVIVGDLKDGPNAADSTITGGGNIPGSLIAGTTADYTLKIPALGATLLPAGTNFYLHVNINSQAGYFVIPMRAEIAPSR